MPFTAAERLIADPAVDALAVRRPFGGTPNILIVLHDLELGGGERIAIRLVNRWAALGRRITLLVGTRKGALAPLLNPAVELVSCEPEIVRGRGSRKRLGKVCTLARLAEPSWDTSAAN